MAPASKISDEDKLKIKILQSKVVSIRKMNEQIPRLETDNAGGESGPAQAAAGSSPSGGSTQPTGDVYISFSRKAHRTQNKRILYADLSK